MIAVTILGSGTSVPSHRAPAAYLVQSGGHSWLLDAGAGCCTALARQRVGLHQLDGVLLTHLHPDHCAELVPMLFALVNPAHPARNAPLEIWGPRGLRDHLAALETVYQRWVRPACGVQAHELGHLDRVNGQGLELCAFEVPHAAGSLAYRLEQQGRVLCYSGDSGPSDALVAAARAADLLLCECSALEQEPLEGHLTAAQVGQLAARAGCTRVVLTHLYEHVVAQDPVARVRELFGGDVLLAEDGLRLELA